MTDEYPRGKISPHNPKHVIGWEDVERIAALESVLRALVDDELGNGWQWIGEDYCECRYCLGRSNPGWAKFPSMIHHDPGCLIVQARKLLEGEA